MLNKPTLRVKIPNIDSSNKIDDVVNYIAKSINGSFQLSIGELMPIGGVLQSVLSEDVFKSQIGKNWSIIGSTVISGTTVNFFQKIN